MFLNYYFALGAPSAVSCQYNTIRYRSNRSHLSVLLGNGDRTATVSAWTSNPTDLMLFTDRL
jgi:hypothetical protein